MANSICVIIRHPPYGREDAYAGIRNAVVTQQNGLPTTLVFCGPGVWNLTGDHRSQAIGMPSNASAMADFFVVGGRVYVDTISLEEHGLDAADLPEGVQVLACEELAEIILGHDVVKPLCGGY